MIKVNASLKKRLMVLLSFVLLGTFASCAEPSPKEKAADSYVPVSVVRIGTGSIKNVINCTGVVKAKEKAIVLPPFSGRVSEVFFNVGDSIKKGEILYTLEATEIEGGLNVLREQLKVAEANVSLAQNSVVAAWGSQYTSQKIQLEDAMRNAENNYLLLKNNFDDYTLQFNQGRITKQQYSEMKTQLKSASSALDSARSAYELYINQLSVENIQTADERLNQAQYTYDAMRYQIANEEKRLEHALVRSPIDGVVFSKNIAQGSMIPSGVIPYIIVSEDPVIVDLSITENIINKIKKGDRMSVQIMAADDKPFTGYVSTISPAINPMTLTYSIGIVIENPEGKIKAGMTARVAVQTDYHQNVLIIPLASVLSSDGESYVYIFESGKAVKRMIQTGLSNNRSIEVLDGLNKGDILVVKGQHYVNDQDIIRIVKGE